MQPRSSSALTCALFLAVILPFLFSCSDDRPVGDTLKPAKNTDDLIKAMYDPAERGEAAERLKPFARFVYRRLAAEVADNGKSSPDEITARVIMLEMISRLDNEPEIESLLIRISRDKKYPEQLRRAAEEGKRRRGK